MAVATIEHTPDILSAETKSEEPTVAIETSRLLLPIAQTLQQAMIQLDGGAACGRKLSQALTAAQESGGGALLDSKVLDSLVAAVDNFSDIISDTYRKVEAAVAAVEEASQQDTAEAQQQAQGQSRYSSAADASQQQSLAFLLLPCL